MFDFFKQIFSVKNPFASAIKHFGLTDNPKEAGYMLPDGRMLDFSGKNQGSSGGTRAFDHRDIGIEESGIENMQAAIKMGAIRLHPETNGVDFYQEPNAIQYRALVNYFSSFNGKITIDFQATPNNGYWANSGDVKYKEYPIGTMPEKIISDIRNHYHGEGYISDVQRFHD